MIQRIQTVWLLLIVLLNVGLLFFAEWKEAIFSFPREWMLNVEIGLTVLTVLLAAVAIFLYKRRPLQITGCYGILIVQIALYVSLFFIFPKFVSIEWTFPMLFPLISFGLAILSIRAIKKDEKLVRSLDRLR